MPRKRKTSSGADAQGTPASVPGVRYGEGVEHQALARALPAADMRDTAPGATVPGAPPAGRGMAPADPAALGQLMAGAPTGALRATARPGEPVTAGLTTGPGPGPMPTATGHTTPLTRSLIELYQATGDPTFMRLARKAGAR